jgi:ribonuclease E
VAAAPAAAAPAAAASPAAPLAPPPTATPIVVPSLQVEHLAPVLAAVGLELVQTDSSKLEQTRQRMADEPPAPRRGRERPILPPVDSAPLQQVETRRD